MDPRTALCRVLPLLLLLLLSPLGGRSLPLSSPDPILEPSAVQELVDGLPVTVAELQGGQMTQKPLQQERRSTEAWEAKQKDSADADEPHNYQELQTERKGCFGRKIDRFSHDSRFGCNVFNDKYPLIGITPPKDTGR